MLDPISTTKMALDVSIRDIAETRSQLDILEAAHSRARYQAGLVLRRFIDNEGILGIKVTTRPGSSKLAVSITYDDTLLPAREDKREVEQAVENLVKVAKPGECRWPLFFWSTLKEAEEAREGEYHPPEPWGIMEDPRPDLDLAFSYQETDGLHRIFNNHGASWQDRSLIALTTGVMIYHELDDNGRYLGFAACVVDVIRNHRQAVVDGKRSFDFPGRGIRVRVEMAPGGRWMLFPEPMGVSQKEEDRDG